MNFVLELLLEYSCYEATFNNPLAKPPVPITTSGLKLLIIREQIPHTRKQFEWKHRVI